MLSFSEKEESMKWFVIIVVAGIALLFITVNMGLWEKSWERIAKNPDIQKLQNGVLQVKHSHDQSSCFKIVPALHLAGGILALRADLLRYPQWLELGQFYESCLRGCPARKDDCAKAYFMLYDADTWLTQNPKPAPQAAQKKPKRVPRRQKKKRRRSN